MYKLLERLILQRIQFLIETASSVHQAGFRKHRSCTKQMMALTTHIEAGFQRQRQDWSSIRWLVCGHTTTYDIGWRHCVKLLLSSVPRQSEQQMASIKQWLTARHRFSSDIIQPIHVGSTVVYLKSVPVRWRHCAGTSSKKIWRLRNPSWRSPRVDSSINGVYVQIHQKLKSTRLTTLLSLTLTSQNILEWLWTKCFPISHIWKKLE
jgi:hypothetical protein